MEEITENRHLFNFLCTLTGLSIFWQQILLQCKKEFYVAFLIRFQPTKNLCDLEKDGALDAKNVLE